MSGLDILKLVQQLVILAIVFNAIHKMQADYYAYVERKRESIDYENLKDELDARKVEFDDYKKRVDGLTLKAGFKL